MKILVAMFSVLILGFASSAPTKEETKKIIFTKETFSDSFLVYKGQHDIVDVALPINSVNVYSINEKNIYQAPNLFFVEADINNFGKKEYKGLYVLNNGRAEKLLDHGSSIATGYNDIKDVYFGASDGIYIYNSKKIAAEKYGSLTDNIIGIAKETGAEAIYILTEDKVVYRVTDKGNVKTKIDLIKNAQQIVLDYKNNLYYYDENKHIYIYNAKNVNKVENLPENPGYVDLIKPTPSIKNRIGVMIDNKNYSIYNNGSAIILESELRFRPSASDFTDPSIQYIAYDKKLYAFNVLVALFQNWISDVKNEFSL